MATLIRVTTIFGGPYVSGGGIQQFYFLDSGGTTAAACAAVKAFWANFVPYLGSGTTVNTVGQVELIQDTDGELVGTAGVTAATVTGSGGTEVLPMASQGLIQWRTGVFSDGREIRGRTFLPAMVETSNTGGVPSGTFAGIAPTYSAALISDSASVLAIWRRPRLERAALGIPGQPGYRPAHSARDGESAPVSSSALSAKWAQLRSRRD